MIISLFWCLCLCVCLYLLFIMMTFILHCSANAILYLVLIHLFLIHLSIQLSVYLSFSYSCEHNMNTIWTHVSALPSTHIVQVCIHTAIEVNNTIQSLTNHLIAYPLILFSFLTDDVSLLFVVSVTIYISSHSKHPTRSAAILSQRDFKSSSSDQQCL